MPTMYLYCETCGDTSRYEQPPCPDGHGADCPEWMCVACGYAVLLGPAPLPVEGEPAGVATAGGTGGAAGPHGAFGPDGATGAGGPAGADGPDDTVGADGPVRVGAVPPRRPATAGAVTDAAQPVPALR